MNALAIDVVSEITKAPTVAMAVVKLVKEKRGREYSRMAPAIAAIHHESLWFFGNIEREVRGETGRETPTPHARVLKWGIHGAAIRTVPGPTEADDPVRVQRAMVYLGALNNLRDIRQQAMTAFYGMRHGGGYPAVRRVLSCSQGRAETLICEARQSMSDFYAGAGRKLG